MSAMTQLVAVFTRWSTASQQRARRNAMVASTALARRRAEIDEVEEFLTSLDAQRRPGAGSHTALG